MRGEKKKKENLLGFLEEKGMKKIGSNCHERERERESVCVCVKTEKELK